MSYALHLLQRPRINRKAPIIRDLVAETRLSPHDFILPIFVCEGKDREPIKSMPGYYRIPLHLLREEMIALYKEGIRAVLLFVKIEDRLKDNTGKEAINREGLFPRAIQIIKAAQPNMILMTDIALDPFSIYGHDGIVAEKTRIIDNDRTVALLQEMGVLYASMGADFIAPSDMMDGRVRALRQALENNGYTQCGIMSYAAKYASALYGPFRDALDSAPGFGDKKTYQMDSANSKEAEREALLDEQEGADIVLVKPASFYLDIVQAVNKVVRIPVGAYQVSGEYAMIKLAAQAGLAEEKSLVMESLLAIKRAGARIIISYFARDFMKYYTEDALL